MHKLLFAGVMMLALTPRAEAAQLYISEYRAITTINTYQAQIAPEPGIDQVPLNFAAGAQTSAAFNSQTRVVRLICDAACHVVFGTGTPTVTDNNKLLAAGIPEYFGVIPGQVVSVKADP